MLTASYGDPNESARQAEQVLATRLGSNWRTETALTATPPAAAPAAAAASDQARRHGGASLEDFLVEEGLSEEAHSPHSPPKGGGELQQWVHARLVAHIAACRSRESALRFELGCRIDIDMLEADEEAGPVLKKMRDLKRLRQLVCRRSAQTADWSVVPNGSTAHAFKRVSGQARAEEDKGLGSKAEELWQEFLLNEEPPDDGSGFHYSRELLRVRQLLPRRGGARRGGTPARSPAQDERMYPWLVRSRTPPCCDSHAAACGATARGRGRGDATGAGAAAGRGRADGGRPGAVPLPVAQPTDRAVRPLARGGREGGRGPRRRPAAPRPRPLLLRPP